jgi:hypothetical protein
MKSAARKIDEQHSARKASDDVQLFRTTVKYSSAIFSSLILRAANSKSVKASFYALKFV